MSSRFNKTPLKYLCFYFVFSDYRTSNGYERAMELMDDEGDDSQNVPSDIDSQVIIFYAELFQFYLIKMYFTQMSLPRSYTLPREFKFNRQGRKIIKNEQFIASTNSSDGEIKIIMRLEGFIENYTAFYQATCRVIAVMKMSSRTISCQSAKEIGELIISTKIDFTRTVLSTT